LLTIEHSTGEHSNGPARAGSTLAGASANLTKGAQVPRFAVLLKGINVGGKKKVSMADLRALLSDIGFTDVATLLQSGNAVFTSGAGKPAKLASQIEEAITDRFGMNVRCLIRSAAELRAVIDGNPLADIATDGSKLVALFLSDAPAPALLAKHDPAALAPGNVQMGDRVIYHWCPNGILEAPDVSAFVEKNLRVTVTGRNWNTVVKLSALLDK
jgi:uncharacterized protein (DUF1697 family)